MSPSFAKVSIQHYEVSLTSPLGKGSRLLARAVAGSDMSVSLQPHPVKCKPPSPVNLLLLELHLPVAIGRRTSICALQTPLQASMRGGGRQLPWWPPDHHLCNLPAVPFTGLSPRLLSSRRGVQTGNRERIKDRKKLGRLWRGGRGKLFFPSLFGQFGSSRNGLSEESGLRRKDTAE